MTGVDKQERGASQRRSSVVFIAALAVLLMRCREPKAGQEQVVPSASVTSTLPALTTSAIEADETTSLSDHELGALMTTLSEQAGEFPSDNLVSNETSYLHVAEALLDPARKGKVYIGVGPEQNFSYMALCEPSLAFIVDIRRDNLLLHLLYKTVFERAATRRSFLSLLLSREDKVSSAQEGDDVSSIDELIEQVGALHRSKVLEEALLRSVVERAAQLSVTLDERDRAHLGQLVEAFASKGLELRYEMRGSSRRYPSLGALLRMRSDQGEPLGFLSTQERYLRVRALQRSNRVVPVVGDLAGSSALPGLAKELKRRGEAVSYFYSSNVEQYLFTPTLWPRWVSNLDGLPWASEAVIVRVYFDQGRRHPLQRGGERTTTLIAPASHFLARARGGGYQSWWEVSAEVTNPPRSR